MIKQLRRIKVWISGYSRATAVSNVTAGTLVNTGFLPKEDVYAYTFAPPRRYPGAAQGRLREYFQHH